MTPETFHRRRAAGEALLLLDVRTEEELERASLEPCMHIPLHLLEQQLEQLAPYRDQEIVCLCHHGIRSATACRYLRMQGFSHVHNLTGGIDAYALEVAPSIPRY